MNMFDPNNPTFENLESMTGVTHVWEDGSTSIDHEFAVLAEELQTKPEIRRLIPICWCHVINETPEEERGGINCGHCSIQARALEEGYEDIPITPDDRAFGASNWLVKMFRKA